MKKLIIISAIFFTSLFGGGFEMSIYAQVADSVVMVNYGATIYLANDVIFANGGISNFPDNTIVAKPGGTFRNSGAVYINNGNWTNSAGNVAFTATDSSNHNSTINFFLFNGIQKIQGTSVTEFHNLTLMGNGKKALSGINAIVKDSLFLNDLELATGANTISVINADTGAIQRTSGFVSSSSLGALIRNTDKSEPYFFPVGAPGLIRPVEITPNNSSANTFSVGMVKGSATSDGFPLTQHEANIKDVNQLYYHQIRRDAGSATASIAMYYDDIDAQGGRFASMAHWQNQPQWEDITAEPSNGKYGLDKVMIKQNWDFNSSFTAFALIKLVNECGEMFVPNAFSPDNNGENDIEFVYGKCIQKIYFSIYDRWGEKVFETTDAHIGWDGSYKGKQLNTGVFVYYLQATLTTGEEVTKKGNISLFR